MAAETTIAWNGIRLAVPRHWEGRVAAARHLVFESGFKPLLQLRWYQQGSQRGPSPGESQRLAAALAGQGEMIGPPCGNGAGDWHQLRRQLETRFHLLAMSPGREKVPPGGVFSCPGCQTIFHFQLFPDQHGKGDIGATGEAAACLATLSCHDHAEDLYRIQDFSLSLPPGFDLTDYSFAPGLTRLSFTAGGLQLQAGRLAPADERLQHQSLAAILLAQTGIPDLQLRETAEPDACEGFRQPTLFRRLLLRLRRDRPYVRARIGHDRLHNRLLTLILSGSRPLPAGLLPELAESYAII